MLVARRICLTFGVVSLSLFLLAPAAMAGTPATVTVRVEGAAGTVLPPTQVTTTTAPMVKEGHSCSGTSAAGALQLATTGNWGGSWFESFGDFLVESIEGESYAGSPSAYWAFWLNNKPAAEGICKTELEPGASILFFPECFGECPAAPAPLGIDAPAVAEVGRPVGVTVVSYANPSGVQSAAKGATIAYEGTSAGTDANGHATLTFAHAGSMTVRVGAPDAIRTETTVCVHNGNDGTCGAPGASGASSSPSVSSAVAGAAGSPYVGPYALVPRLSDLIDGHTYRRGHAPRILSGSILAHTTVSSVSLTLRRERRGRCYAFDGTTTRFVHARCGTGHPFAVSSNGTFSYLLPSALAPGHYVLDIEASDAAGNRTTLARGTSRIVFYVR